VSVAQRAVAAADTSARGLFGLPDRATLVLRAGEELGMRLPRRVGVPLAERAMGLFHRFGTRQRETVARNLAHVLGYPPDSEIVAEATRECFRLYGRYWYETFAIRAMPAEEVRRRFPIEGLEHADRALERGTGVILALPHMGNWDAAGHALCLHGYRMTAVAEELKPEGVFDLFLRHRRALGMNIVPLSGNGVGPALVGLLAENHVLTLVADRDLGGRGVAVEMFGAHRKVPAGPAYLSLATGAPLCAAAVVTTEEGAHTMIGPPLEVERTGSTRDDVRALTRALAAEFERSIARAPTDWHMFQPAWPEDEVASANGSPAGAPEQVSRAR
jgi:phosphatidylinositol dimannoside acyltransferase